MCAEYFECLGYTAEEPDTPMLSCILCGQQCCLAVVHVSPSVTPNPLTLIYVVATDWLSEL